MLKCALVGCGRVSPTHLDSIGHFYKEGRVKLVGLCDIIEERAIKSKESYFLKTGDNDIRTYSSIDQMLVNEELDLVAIATPSGLHPEHGIKVAKKKVNVLVEKPISCDLESADNLIQTCDENKVKLFVVKQNRLNPTIHALINAVSQGRFGKVYMIQSNLFWLRRQNYYDSDSWRGKLSLDGGAFLNQAVHYVDIVQKLGGPIDSVAAFVDHLERNIEAEDSGSAIIRFKSGAIGNMNVTMLTSIGDYEGSITVVGEKGFVKIGGRCLNQIKEWSFIEPFEEDENIKAENYLPSSIYGHGHLALYGKCIDSLTKGEEIFVDGNEARKSLELVLAMYKSSNEKQIVTL